MEITEKVAYIKGLAEMKLFQVAEKAVRYPVFFFRGAQISAKDISSVKIKPGAGIYCGIGTVQQVYGLSAPPFCCLVLYVIMNQGGCVDKLQGGGKAY